MDKVEKLYKNFGILADAKEKINEVIICCIVCNFSLDDETSDSERSYTFEEFFSKRLIN